MSKYLNILIMHSYAYLGLVHRGSMHHHTCGRCPRPAPLSEQQDSSIPKSTRSFYSTKTTISKTLHCVVANDAAALRTSNHATLVWYSASYEIVVGNECLRLFPTVPHLLYPTPQCHRFLPIQPMHAIYQRHEQEDHDCGAPLSTDKSRAAGISEAPFSLSTPLLFVLFVVAAWCIVAIVEKNNSIDTLNDDGWRLCFAFDVSVDC